MKAKTTLEPEEISRAVKIPSNGTFQLDAGKRNELKPSCQELSGNELDPPRWPGGPPICKTANLPAIATEKELDAFNKANGPSCKVVRKWKCWTCDHWHAETIAPDPAGGSSGTGRSAKEL